MKLRKLFSNGTSTLLAIPPEFLSAMHAEKGDYLKIELGRGNVVHLSKLIDSNSPTARRMIKGDSAHGHQQN